jgi:HSP20 family molecular chaperone IbpA
MFNYFSKSTVSTNSKEVVIKCYVPGYGKEDLEISVEDLVLSVKTKDGNLNYQWDISNKLNLENTVAECDKGILTITIPKQTSNKLSIDIK